MVAVWLICKDAPNYNMSMGNTRRKRSRVIPTREDREKGKTKTLEAQKGIRKIHLPTSEGRSEG